MNEINFITEDTFAVKTDNEPLHRWYCEICKENFTHEDFHTSLGLLREHLIIKHNVPPQWHMRCHEK